MTRRTLLLTTIFLCIGCTAWAGTCAIGTLAIYDTAGFSCTLDGFTFSNFSYSASASGGASAPDAAGVAVTPITGTETGLQFNAAWIVGSGQTEDAAIGYTVTCPSCITDLVLTMTGAATGTGIGGVAEQAGALPSLGVSTGGPSSASETFAPVSSLSVTKDIGVSGGANGTAHISVVDNLFSRTAIPEPSLLLVCTGLLGLIPLARRRLQR